VTSQPLADPIDPVDPTPPEPDPVVTGAAVVVLLVAAAFLGAAGAFLQLTAPPWGLVFALLAAAALPLALAWLGYGRILRLAVAALWVLGAVSPAMWRRGGDLVLPDDTRSRIYLYGGTLLMVLLLAVAARRRSVPTSDGPPSGR